MSPVAPETKKNRNIQDREILEFRGATIYNRKIKNGIKKSPSQKDRISKEANNKDSL
jgi:hypothetical protein